MAISNTTQGGLPVTMSFGVSASEPSRFEYEKVLEAADRALYAAKAVGRNRDHINAGADLSLELLQTTQLKTASGARVPVSL